MKFKEMNLTGFAHFAIKMREIFKDYSVIYESHSGSRELTISSLENKEGVSVNFYNPIGGEPDMDDFEKIILSDPCSVKIEFYHTCFSKPFELPIVPLSYFDKSEFTETLKNFIGQRPLVPYGEDDVNILIKYAESFFEKEIKKSKIMTFFV